MLNSDLIMSGNLSTRLIPAQKASSTWRLRNILRLSYAWGWLTVLLAKAFSKMTGIAVLTSELRARKWDSVAQKWIDFGILSRRVVTTAFVNFVVDQLQTETSVFGDFKFHDSGVGTTAENVTDTGMETTDAETRATGTQTETSANIYRSVGTISYTTTKAITEHGLFNDASAGTLMDRSVFSAINVVNGDSISFTYSLTVSAGG